MAGMSTSACRRKGSALAPPAVRAALTAHVAARGLASAERRGAVVLDSVLAAVVGKQEQVRCARNGYHVSHLLLCMLFLSNTSSERTAGAHFQRAPAGLAR